MRFLREKHNIIFLFPHTTEEPYESALSKNQVDELPRHKSLCNVKDFFGIIRP